MALRVTEVDLGGQKVPIGNLQLRPLRVMQEALDEIRNSKDGDPKKMSRVTEAKKAVVLASVKRANPDFTLAQLEDLDPDDLEELFVAVMAWTGRGREKPADPPPSP
jgi:hypothetical protein